MTRRSQQQSTKGALQQLQFLPVGAHIHSAGPPGIKNVQGLYLAKKVLVHGRGQGMAGQMGRGRPMSNKQNLWVVESIPQPCIVSVKGLLSTTDVQLKSLLISVEPIQGGESDGFFHLEGQPQWLPKPPAVRQQPVRKVTLTNGTPRKNLSSYQTALHHRCLCCPNLPQSPGPAPCPLPGSGSTP